jgi:hypothetical protein
MAYSPLADWAADVYLDGLDCYPFAPPEHQRTRSTHIKKEPNPTGPAPFLYKTHCLLSVFVRKRVNFIKV